MWRYNTLKFAFAFIIYIYQQQAVLLKDIKKDIYKISRKKNAEKAPRLEFGSNFPVEYLFTDGKNTRSRITVKQIPKFRSEF